MHVTVIEEAHRLLARPAGGKSGQDAQAKEKAAESFANTLAENRKYGEGVLIAEQIPVKLVEDAVKNTGLKIMHRLTAEEDRRYLGESMGLDDAQMRFTTRLQTGEALVYSDEFTEATHLDIPRTVSVVGAAAGRASGRATLRCVRDLPGQVRLPRGGPGHGARPVPGEAVRDDGRDAAGLEPASRGDEGGLEGADRQRCRARVTSFGALPSEGSAVDDAAYCLFVHTLAIRTMKFSPAWPRAVAKRLGIPQSPPGEGASV